MSEVSKDAYNAIITDRVDLHDDLALFYVQYKDRPIPDFIPGQFCTLGLPKLTPPRPGAKPRKKPRLTRRAYSIASSPNKKDALELLIVRIEDGSLTPRLFDMKPGDDIFMDEDIRGEFTMDDCPTGKNLIMVSTGTGLAPFKAMLDFYEGKQRWDKLAIINGCRYSQDLGYFDELKQRSTDSETFFYLPSVTREPEESSYSGPRGRVYPLVEEIEAHTNGAIPLDPANTEIYLCGHPDMISTLSETLTEKGFTITTHQERGNVHYERYW